MKELKIRLEYLWWKYSALYLVLIFISQIALALFDWWSVFSGITLQTMQLINLFNLGLWGVLGLTLKTDWKKNYLILARKLEKAGLESAAHSVRAEREASSYWIEVLEKQREFSF